MKAVILAGGRPKRVVEHLQGEDSFCLSYGDETLWERALLEELWASGRSAWKVWE